MASNQPPKILYLITLSEWGGAQKYVFDLAAHCQTQGLSVTVACGGDPEGELIKILVRSNIQTYYLRHLQRSLNLKHDLLAFLDLIKLFRQVKPDVVHLNSSKSGALGALAARLAGVKKIIYTIHGLVLNEPLSKSARAFYWFSEWFSAKLKNKLICVSDFDKKSLLKNKITNPQKIIVLHNGLASEHLFFWDKEAARAKLSEISGQNFKEFDQLIGVIANFYPVKGLTYLIEAAKEAIAIYPAAKFIIIGDGPLKNQLQKMVNDYGLGQQVILTGSLFNASQYLKAFDLFVLPSLKEGLAYALLEATAAHLPIIATSVGGNPEVITDNFNGLLVAPADFSALATAIINLLQDQNKRAAFSANSFSVIKEFSLADMCQKTMALYLN